MMKRKATSGRTEGMRRVCYFGLALTVVSLVGPPAYALNPMGPPASDLRKGEYMGGIDVSLSRQDLETTPGAWARYIGGALADSGAATLATLDNFEMYRAHATLGFGLTHSWEAFLRMGGTTGELGDEIWGEGEQFDSRTELAVGAGVKVTFFEEMALKIGGLVQANYCEFDGQLIASQWAAPHFIEIEMLEVQAALGVTYLFSDRVSVYGGPFAHVIYGDLDYVYCEADGGAVITWRFAWDIDDDIAYGGYLGTRVVLGKDCSLNVEYQQTGNANAIGASLMCRL
jgi:hypothetical protein